METKEKLQYLPVTEVKAKGNFLKAIGFKPKLAPILCAIAGIALLLPSNLYARLLGAFIIVLSLAVLALVKDYKVMDIFDRLHSEGMTIVMITHERAVAERAKRIMRIRDGWLQEEQGR